MRCGFAFVVLLSLFVVSCARHQEAKPSGPGAFDAGFAMRTLFGNFDPVRKISFYRVPTGASQDPNFGDKDEIHAHLFFTQEVTENGTRKVYVLTWAKPAGQPFDCRGCSPLISAAVFAAGEQSWTVESVGRAALTFGDFGKPPQAKLLEIGPEHHGFLLRVTSTQANTTTREALLVPWKGTVQEAFRTVVADTNRGDCGGAYPCYGNERELTFTPGTNSEYYDLMVTLSGTDMSPKPPFHLRKVSGAERLQFENGRYVPAERGATITADND